jgi:molybdopterin-containing oxidoreductase family membrane subunit
VALCAVGMAGAFIVADLGRPDRLWHLLPLLGAFNWPASLFTWDVVALGGYAMLNAFILFASWRSARRHGDAHRPRWRAPFVVLAVTWAIAIHTVTAFLYAGLGARPFWHTALLAPRFLASAFVSGPALLLVILAWLARSDRSREVTAGEAVPAVSRQVRDTLVRVMRVTALVDLLMLASEVFVGLHAGGTERDAVRLLVLGLDGHGDLVPWFWTALGLHVIGVGLLARPARDLGRGRLLGACGALFAAVWFEKGLGFLLPGFLPAPTDAVAAYRPSAIEWSVTGGIWAAGALALSLGLRAFGPLLRSGRAAEAEAEAVPTARETRPGQEGERAAPPRKGA